jgi:tetratricopeptide (TPR) repeat protein
MRRLIAIGAVLTTALVSVSLVADDTDRLGLAVRLNDQGRHEEARSLLETIIAEEPDNHRALWNRGLVAMQNGDQDAAIRAFDQAISLADEIAEYHLWKGYAHARKLERCGPVRKLFIAPKVRRSLERAVELDPDDVKGREALMQYYRRAPGFLGGDEDKAAAQAKAIRRLAIGPEMPR